MSLAVIPLAFLNLLAQYLRGLKWVVESVLAAGVLVPLITLGVLVATARPGDATSAAAAFVTATFATALLAALASLRRSVRALPEDRSAIAYQPLVASCLPLYWTSILAAANAWFLPLLVGLWVDSAGVAQFAVAQRVAFLISFILVAVNVLAAPKFAALHQAGDLFSLERTARSCALLMAVIAAGPSLLLIATPQLVLGLFGEQFAAAALPLAILALGQFVNVATGSVSFLLMMSGNERLHRNNVTVWTLLNVLGCCVLIPRYGVLGAAISSSAAVALQNVSAAYLVRRRVGISSIPILPPAPGLEGRA
jgi:O-antigen/teichoic acid export membrane protein